MKNAIQKIIEEVLSTYFFDAHYVIFNILEKHSNLYLSAYSGGTTASYHGQLANVIREFEGDLVEQQDGTSWSKNIRGNYSECSLWKRI